MLRALWQALVAPGRRWCTLVAAFGCAFALWLPAHTSLPAVCGALSRIPARDWLLLMGPGWTLADAAAGWIVMLVAMMPPLLAEPMRHVWFASLPRRRTWAAVLFVSAYVFVWTLAAPVLLLLTWTCRGSGSEMQDVAVGLGAAMLWSASPLAQHARNRCHRVLRVGATGHRADRECVSYGLYAGAMCVAVCWPWMLVVLLVESAHLAVMLAIGLWLIMDRLFPPRRPAWQLPPALGRAVWRLTR